MTVLVAYVSAEIAAFSVLRGTRGGSMGHLWIYPYTAGNSQIQAHLQQSLHWKVKPCNTPFFYLLLYFSVNKLVKKQSFISAMCHYFFTIRPAIDLLAFNTTVQQCLLPYFWQINPQNPQDLLLLLELNLQAQTPHRKMPSGPRVNSDNLPGNASMGKLHQSYCLFTLS